MPEKFPVRGNFNIADIVLTLQRVACGDVFISAPLPRLIPKSISATIKNYGLQKNISVGVGADVRFLGWSLLWK